MGISNRDYIRDEPPSWGGGGGGFTPANDEWAIRSIIIACVAVFFVQTLTMERDPLTGATIGGITNWLHLDWSGLQSFQVWRVITYGFCHGGIGHLFWNMIGLYVFSRSLESLYGPRETLAFFLVTVAVSGLIEVGVQHFTGHTVGVVGASGGLMGILLLAAWHFPTRPMGLLFLPITFELRWIASAFVLLDIFRVMGESNGIASLAHLSGAFVGYLYFQWGGRILPSSGGHSSRRRGGGIKRFFARLKPSAGAKPGVRIYEPPKVEKNLDSEVDRLLDKINRDGRESLTPEENEILLKASEKYRNRV